MRIGIGLSLAARGSRFDVEDLAKGTLQLSFTAPNDVTLSMDFTADIYRAWVDDPTWTYGTTGIFKVKA
ncbi:MAG: hypothetical protein V4468_03445 [Pseudomonadota bacterium]